jgi:nucleotide-binding universal stress UspA family protein
MYQTILVPLDGSKRAEAILPHVEELAQRCSATVILLQVVEPFSVPIGPAGPNLALDVPMVEQLMNDARLYLANLEGVFREKRIDAQIRVIFGPVVATILDVAKREGVDLIAMSSHGRTGLSRVFYGSVAAGVLHGVDRPLLIVRSAGGE